MLGAVDAALLAVTGAPLVVETPEEVEPLATAALLFAEAADGESSAAGERAQLAVHTSPASIHRNFRMIRYWMKTRKKPWPFTPLGNSLKLPVYVTVPSAKGYGATVQPAGGVALIFGSGAAGSML